MQSPIEGTFHGRFWLDKQGFAYLGRGRVELLQRIDERKSIAHAAKAMGMSYKAAWDAVKRMEALSDQTLVVKTRGGSYGGETRLTPYGREVIRIYRVFETEYERFLRAMSQRLGRFIFIEDLSKRFTMQTSARNQFWGRVESIERGAVNSLVTLSIGGSGKIVASITNGSVDSLALKTGKEACALIKASMVIVVPGNQAVKTSARNHLQGTVKRCDIGAVNGEIAIGIGDGKEVVATITNESIRSLQLAVGVPAAALIKSSHVIIAVND